MEPVKRALSGSPPPVVARTSPRPPLKKAKLDDEPTAPLPLPTTTAPAPAPTVESSSIATTNEAVPEVASTAAVVDAAKPAGAAKGGGGKARQPRQQPDNTRGRGKGRGKPKPHKPGGAEETGQFDVVELLGKERVEEMDKAAQDDGKDWRLEAEKEWGKAQDGKDVEVRVVGMSAHGDGLAILSSASTSLPTRILTIPFTLPNELALVHIHRHEPDYYMSHADLVRIVEPSPDRQRPAIEIEGSAAPAAEDVSPELAAVRAKFGERVQCKYFGVCSGCQYQPLSYEHQLTLKQSVVRKAFANFSLLDPSLIPAVGPTLPSPLQYGYRTKLTPHFQAPPANGKSTGGGRRGKGKGKQPEAEEQVEERDWEVTIGFEEKGRKRIIDIEECVIATQVINTALVSERAAVKANIASYKRGATILLRDSLPPRSEGTTRPAPGEPFPSESHVCITDHHATVREQVGTVEFEQMAGSFFQNNNSILPSLLAYIANAAKGPVVPTGVEAQKRYLIDAYCGSGLFAISLADQFDVIEGVEIDKASVKWAKLNAEYNKGEGRGVVGFRAGNAEDIFGTIEFPPAQTTILIDPPRKGCDSLFLSQLLAFNPSTIIYVSCNVHTQARDIGWIVTESAKKAAEAGDGKKGFWIESVRAADLFANTHHAEGVAVLRREV
ncbi:hypothetical protein RQP46_001594 [Phenoliferia psychrophenolica]